MRTATPHKPAFTLIEMLVVIGIIGLLIGLLLPSLKGARVSANKMKVAAQLKAIGDALEMFKNDVGDYPDSSKREDPTERSYDGYTPPGGVSLNGATLYGAQALVRALVGKDFKGYVSRKRARKFNPSSNPPDYYDEGTYSSDYPRQDIYLSEKNDLVATKTLPGRVPAAVTGDPELFENVVLEDAFGRAVLYYKANPRGNLIADAAANGTGPDGFSEPDDPGAYGECIPAVVDQYGERVIPYYNLLDNDIFTGAESDLVGTSDQQGWRFGTEDHLIRDLGDPCDPDCTDGGNCNTKMPFIKYIHDHKSEAAGAVNPSGQPIGLKPVNPDTYLLISAGPDGNYGSSDDVNNFQKR